MFSSGGADRDDARRTSIGSRYVEDRSEVVIYFCDNIDRSKLARSVRNKLCGRPVINPNSTTCRTCLREQTEGWPDV